MEFLYFDQIEEAFIYLFLFLWKVSFVATPNTLEKQLPTERNHLAVAIYKDALYYT